MKGWFWLASAVLIPVIVAWTNGSTYTFAFSLVGVGLFLYIANIVLMNVFIRRRVPRGFEDDSWEATAGLGIVPKWVSLAGLLGMGFVPAGIVVAALLWLDVVPNNM